MKPFTKVNIPFNWKLATPENCRGPQTTTSTGTVYPFKMNRAYMVFKPEVFKALGCNQVDWCEIQTQVAPHIDIVATVRLNVYIIANGGVTSFYSEKPSSKPTMANYKQAKRSGIPNIYNRNDLEFESSFTAERFDAYVLDTKVVHDVSPGNGSRAFIQFTWCTTPYAEVLDRLKGWIDG